jgi:hypothetical protein
MLILGGPDVSPALPGGQLTGGTPSGVPDIAVSRWEQIIAQVRGRFNGTIAWALPFPWQFEQVPAEILSSVDQVYILFSPQLSENNPIEYSQLVLEIEDILDEELFPSVAQFEKPILLGIDYPATDGAVRGCIPLEDDSCVSFEQLAMNLDGFSGQALDLEEQKLIYSAMLTAIGDREWITGFVSRGFYIPVALQDPSPSIHGKPASDVINYWFPKLLGR